jgi:hypothetical protein
MYRLLVFNPAHPDAPLTVKLATATEVLEMIPRLAGDHPECDRIEVFGPRGMLFSVDCQAVYRPPLQAAGLS